MSKKVLAITGIRSEYEISFPAIDALRNDPGIDLKLAVSGAHLSDWHGDTFKKIEEDGFEAVDRIDNLLLTNRKTQRAKGVGILTTALTQTVERESPDFLFAIGDREEAIATALVVITWTCWCCISAEETCLQQRRRSNTLCCL